MKTPSRNMSPSHRKTTILKLAGFRDRGGATIHVDGKPQLKFGLSSFATELIFGADAKVDDVVEICR